MHPGVIDIETITFLAIANLKTKSSKNQKLRLNLMSNPPPSQNLKNLPIPDEQLPRVERLRRLSHLLDNAIALPGTNYRVGLDPVIGLIPGGGDTVGLVLSSYILIEAAQFGASRSTLGRMTFNILLETLVGMIPFLGDLFDVAWKANAMNMKLLEEHLAAPQPTGAKNSLFLAFLLTMLVVTTLVAVVLTVVVLRWVVQISQLTFG
jgi:hypothetical protein